MGVVISGRVFKFGGHEEELLLEIALRLEKGAEQYGDFDVLCGKDWLREAHEEDLDGIVYRVAHILRERRERKDRDGH